MAVASFDFVYTSTDGGVSWTARDGVRDWYAVASSADGTRLAAVGLDDQIYTSSDSGLTWTARESSRTWFSVASSADGRRLVAVEFTGKIYTSVDAGVSWVARESDRLVDQRHLVGGRRLARRRSPRPSLHHDERGRRWVPPDRSAVAAYDSVELQSLGDGRFNVIGHEGSLTVE